MSDITQRYSNELAKISIWDPNEKGLEPEVNINPAKISHLTKRYLAEVGHTGTDKERYQLAKHHSNGDNILLMMGMITMEDYNKSTEKGLATKGGLYPPVIEEPKDYLRALRDAQIKLTELHAKPTQIHSDTLGELNMPPESTRLAMDALLESNKLPKLEDLFNHVMEAEEKIGTAKKETSAAKRSLTKKDKELDRLKGEVTNLLSKSMSNNVAVEYTNEATEIPNGKVVMKKVKDVWPEMTHTPRMAELEVPTWDWDGPHPLVPQVKDGYIFRTKNLERTLYALVTNQREYKQGHTGAGKTTLYEQVAARLNYPFVRINFDSEITRMDLIGREKLMVDEDGNTYSEFIDGMLPSAMASPCICCFDEIDFVRPDVAYVMQAALEGNGLRITEDGDRIVHPHPMFRMFGTGNTVGQGDEHGMYQGARPQSMAFLDRFTVWDQVEYLDPKERETLVTSQYPALDDLERKAILQYTAEHLEAFEQGKVIQPISPRGILAICQATVMLGNIKDALEMTVIDRANKEDRATLLGLVQRVSE